MVWLYESYWKSFFSSFPRLQVFYIIKGINDAGALGIEAVAPDCYREYKHKARPRYKEGKRPNCNKNLEEESENLPTYPLICEFLEIKI